MLQILHLEDCENDAVLVGKTLIDAGIAVQITVAGSRREYLSQLEQKRFDLVLADNSVSGFSSLEALKAFRKKSVDGGFICVSGGIKKEMVAAILSAGATECVIKDNLARLPVIVHREQERLRLIWLNRGMTRLVQAVQELSLARDLDAIMTVVRRAARELTGADGATFVLRDGDNCYYADENAIAPLWKGQRFPLETCISGWAMLNRQSAIVPDIYADPRIPTDAYRPTFVKSLAMVPIRTADPIAAIGNYWATPHTPTAEQVELLQALANTTAVAMENIQVYSELEQRVKDRTAQLADANRELDSFTHAVSHDLRAPLRSIEGFSQLALQELGDSLNEQGRAYLARVQSSAVRMRSLIDDLMMLSRVTRAELGRHPVDLTSLTREILSQLSGNDPDRKVKISVANGMTVEGDSGLLRIVLENLLSNAWKYTANKKVPQINFKKITLPDGVQAYCVRDNGAGFDMQYADKLFQPFQRLHGQDEFPGTGIGLTTVERIIRRHGGRIWAEAAVDKGAGFFFTL